MFVSILVGIGKRIDNLEQSRIVLLENSPFGKSQTYAPLFERLEKLEDYIKKNITIIADDMLSRLVSIEKVITKIEGNMV